MAKELPGLLGPVPSRRPGAGLAPVGAGPFDAVVAITRGGLVPAAIVARELGIRVIETVCVASYDYDKQGDDSGAENGGRGHRRRRRRRGGY